MKEEVTQSQLDQMEVYLDKLFGKLGIDVEFTRHFLDRINDPRNPTPITGAQLLKLYKQIYREYGKEIAMKPDDFQAVLKDLSTDLNVPFVINVDRHGDIEMVAKTIMKKKNFRTSNPEYRVGESMKKIKESIHEWWIVSYDSITGYHVVLEGVFNEEAAEERLDYWENDYPNASIYQTDKLPTRYTYVNKTNELLPSYLDVKGLQDDYTVTEAYQVVKGVDHRRYGDRSREGLEGPFMTSSGKTVYYDPKEGKYYDPDTDFYIDHDDYFKFYNPDYPRESKTVTLTKDHFVEDQVIPAGTKVKITEETYEAYEIGRGGL